MGAVVSRPPLVGVSTSEVRRATDHSVVPQGEPSRRELALGERYLDSVRSAGGLPVILTPVHGSAIDPLLARLDAVCLSGGPDLHPSAYGAEAHEKLGPTEPELDLFELALARRAVRRGVPVLGICRGAQVLNVALGGTLHQHLPDLSAEVEHRQQASGRQVTHEVKLASDSRLAKLMGRTEVRVNSFHHQAPATLGPRAARCRHGRRRNRRGPRERRQGLRVRSPVARRGPRRDARALRPVRGARAGGCRALRRRLESGLTR